MERERLNSLIYDRLLTGHAGSDVREELREIATGLVGRGAEVLILACTDLAAHFDPTVTGVLVFDTTDAHARAIAAAIRRGR